MSSIRSTIPVLAVPDVPAALQYYEAKLGFRIKGQMGEPVSYGIVERDGSTIHFVFSHHPIALAQAVGGNVDDGKGGLYVEVEDVDAVAVELEGRGAVAGIMPQDKPYGMRDFWFRDLNGYLIAFGMPLKAHA